MYTKNTDKRDRLRNFKKLLEYRCLVKYNESTNISPDEIKMHNAYIGFIIFQIIDKIKMYYFGRTGDYAKERETKEELMDFLNNDSWFVGSLVGMRREELIELVKEYIILDKQ